MKLNLFHSRLARGKQETDEENLQLKKQIEAEQLANKEHKEKAHADALWASFMSDVTPPAKSKQNSQVNGEKSASSLSVSVDWPVIAVRCTCGFLSFFGLRDE